MPVLRGHPYHLFFNEGITVKTLFIIVRKGCFVVHIQKIYIGIKFVYLFIN